MNIFSTHTAPAANTNAAIVAKAVEPTPAPTGRTFEVDQMYHGRFVTNADSLFVYKIVRRTAKSVWVQQIIPGTQTPTGDVERKAIKSSYYGDYEIIYPMGRYSMCPILGADKPYA